MTRFISVFALVLLIAGCSDEPRPQEWRFALEEIQGSVQDAYAQRFKELVEARTNGRIHVSVYPYGTLGTSAQLTEQVRSGAVQFAFASPGHLGAVIPEVQVFSLHFLFSDDERVNQSILAGDAPLRDLLGEAYREKGLQLLDIVQEGWMVWTGNSPLRSLADFDGFKIRTMVSPLLVEAYKAYGASPTPMPYADVYSGLQLNMIDGQVNPVFAIEEMSFHEVQKAMTFANHLPFVSTLVTHPGFYGSLEAADRQLLDAIRVELASYIFEQQRRFNAERLEKITSNSDIEVIHLDASARAAFQAASLPVRERFAELAGPRGEALVQRVLTARAALEGQSSTTGSSP